MTTQETSNQQMYEVDLPLLRFMLQRDFSYFRHVLYRLRPVEIEGYHTMGVTSNGLLIYGNPLPYTLQDQVFILYHEVNHWVRKHFQRMGDREPTRWNKCGDLEINDEFPESLVRPENALLPGSANLPDGQLAEWYYERLPIYELHAREDATSVSCGVGPCTEQGCDSEDKDPSHNRKGELTTPGVIHAPVACGSASGAPGDEATREAEAKAMEGEAGKDAISEVEADAIRKQVASDVHSQKGRGTIPASLARWADEILNPKVPWTKLLATYARRAFIITSGYNERSYSKLSRKSHDPIVIPKHISRKPVPAFYIDTSGSVGPDLLEKAVAEVYGAVRAHASLMYVTSVDAEIHETHKIQSPSEVKRLKLSGGGGTDMRLCFEHAKTLNPRPNMIVVITDGYTPWPEHAMPGVSTIVVLTDDGESPAWARTVRVDGGDDE